MTSFLIYILAALGVIIIITILGLILAQIFINRADNAQTYMNMIFEQPQGVTIDIDELPDAEKQPGITVISNDVIEGRTHRHHHHLKKKTISVIDQNASINHINNKNTIKGSIYTYKGLMIPTKTDSDIISSNTSIANPLTDKITLEY